ncbi:Hint domain-containing protein [Jiella pacifica]|uniref:Hedgehog/Intein (Hint) domain-containing protein n=1 Tax=Jiella pacifica TaxID=2696469 RepID=A0A6N9T1V1_9HYPH|nr:Hint domain-containing protein [Jiella pacifica]NDW05334.1 hypothetical protein [Jiella pacifica]
MPITFNNVEYPAGYVSSATQSGNQFTVIQLSPYTITMNGTINNPGDTIVASFDGFPRTLVATEFDDSGNIVFSENTNIFVFSNTPSSDGHVFSFSETSLGEYEPLCFATGTNICVICGGNQTEIAVEDLRVGDLALTASGSERPVVWIASRTIDCSGENSRMAPVRVMANAFGPGVPARDVFLSPGHPVLVKQDGAEVLVPIMNLINGTTIERTAMPSVTYWHVELDQHDVILADGLAAESFFDMGSRSWFESESNDVLANPDLVWSGSNGRCREVHLDGPVVEAERKRLADLFYASLNEQCDWPTLEQRAAL